MVASPKNEKSGTLIPTKAFVDGMLESGDYEAKYVLAPHQALPRRPHLLGTPERKLFHQGRRCSRNTEKAQNRRLCHLEFSAFSFQRSRTDESPDGQNRRNGPSLHGPKARQSRQHEQTFKTRNPGKESSCCQAVPGVTSTWSMNRFESNSTSSWEKTATT